MRLKKLTGLLNKNQKFPYLISSLINLNYLLGFKGTYGYLLIDKKGMFFISDSRYEEYSKLILPDSVEFILQNRSIFETLNDLSKRLDYNSLYVEEQSLTLSTYLMMEKSLNDVNIIPGGNEVNTLRIIKDEDELSNIRKAVEISDRCFKHLLDIIKPGITEWDVAVEIEHYYLKNGCRKSAFDSVVASGKGSSMPHYVTSMTKKIEKNDILLIDMGCTYNEYNSDLTRTIFINSIDPEFKRIYEIVKRASDCAISSVKSGISSGKLDKISRDIISREGYGWAFGHSLGHGVGLDVHEIPAVKSGNSFRLKRNVVITIEPGIYLPDSGGIRIEDIVLVTKDGYEVLTGSTKDIIII